MMRLAVLHMITRLVRGGADENTLFTVNRLDQMCYRVGLVVGGQSEDAMIARVAPHVKVYKLAELVREISPRQDFAAICKVTRLLRDENYQIIHTHAAKAGIVGRTAAFAARTPIIVHGVHGTTFHEHLDRSHFALYWALEKAAAQVTDAFVPVGEDLKERYVSAGIAPRHKFSVIRSGMDLAPFQTAAKLIGEKRREIRQSLGINPDDVLVGMVARLEARKGYHYFLDIAENICQSQKDVSFVGVGAGELKESLEQEIIRRGLANKVKFPGFRSDIANVMASLDVIVLTSLWEGLPRVLVQAAMAGVPAVTFAVEGAWEVVRHGVNGYVVPLRDVQTMTRHVSEMTRNPERTRQMGLAGQKLIHEGWTIESMVNEISNLYQTLWINHTAEGVHP